MSKKPITDQEFLDLKEKLSKLSLRQKIFSLVMQFGDEDYYYPEWVSEIRKIDGQEFSLGIEPISKQDEYSIINGIKEGWTWRKYAIKRELFMNSLDKCKTFTESEWLIESKLKDIEDEKRDWTDNSWEKRQYESDVRKTDIVYSMNIDDHVLSMVSNASAIYKFEIFLHEQLRKLRNLPTQIDDRIDEDLPTLDSLNEKEKLVLMYQLGIIKYLEDKFEQTSNRKVFSNLLCLVFGIDIKTKTAEKLYDAVKKMYGSDKNKSPINNTNLKKVNSYLQLLNISLPKAKK